MSRLKIALCQNDIVWASPAANGENLRRTVEAHPDADLFVLPEMFSTGFATHPEGIAETYPYQSLSLMRELADDRGCAIAGSVAVEEDGNFFNRFFFVRPGEETVWYDKKHLFTYGGEHERFRAGDNRVVVEWKGVRFLLEVCYDLRFPVWSRNRGDYDAILYVASWPSVRRFAWDSLLKARAIENQCFVAGVNRVGNDPYLEYDGGSVLLDPWGRAVAACQDRTAETVLAEIDTDTLESFRKAFPVGDDSDAFELK